MCQAALVRKDFAASRRLGRNLRRSETASGTSPRSTLQMLAPPVTRAAPLQKTTRWVPTRANESRWVDGRAQAGGFGRRSPLRRPRAMPLSKRVNPIAKKTRCAASEGFLRAARVGPLAGGGSISEPQPAGFRTSGVAVAPPAFPVRSWKFPVQFATRKPGIGLQAAPRGAFSAIGVAESGRPLAQIPCKFPDTGNFS